MTNGTDGAAPIAAIVLAAGQGRRFAAAAAGEFKLLATLDGLPLVRRVVDAALHSMARDVVVITGHESQAVMAALAGTRVCEARNPRYAEGLSTSLQVGIASLPADIAGAVVLLADMPHINAAVIDALIAAFRWRLDAHAVVPVHKGRSGNPVLLSRALFPAVAALTGDEGARRLLGDTSDVLGVDIDDDAITLDVDTPDALARLRRA